jgi:hypothetical protein
MAPPGDRSKRSSSWDDETLARESSDRGDRLAANAKLARELAKFGTVDSVPWVMISDAASRALPLTPSARRVLAEIDGRRTIATIVELTALPSAEVFTAIIDLATRGAIVLR